MKANQHDNDDVDDDDKDDDDVNVQLLTEVVHCRPTAPNVLKL